MHSLTWRGVSLSAYILLIHNSMIYWLHKLLIAFCLLSEMSVWSFYCIDVGEIMLYLCTCSLFGIPYWSKPRKVWQFVRCLLQSSVTWHSCWLTYLAFLIRCVFGDIVSVGCSSRNWVTLDEEQLLNNRRIWIRGCLIVTLNIIPVVCAWVSYLF